MNSFLENYGEPIAYVFTIAIVIFLVCRQSQKKTKPISPQVVDEAFSTLKGYCEAIIILLGISSSSFIGTIGIKYVLKSIKNIDHTLPWGNLTDTSALLVSQGLDLSIASIIIMMEIAVGIFCLGLLIVYRTRKLEKNK